MFYWSNKYLVCKQFVTSHEQKNPGYEQQGQWGALIITVIVVIVSVIISTFYHL